MLLGEPPRTQFDINFSIFGFRIRIAGFFWLAAILLGISSSDRQLDLLLIWIAAVFLSILIHELGHAFAFRYYGIQSHIVLYHFGGLAIPDGYGASFGGGRSRDSYSQIVISLTGPVAQIGAACVLIALVALSGHRPPLLGFAAYLLPDVNAPDLPSRALYVFSTFFLYISIYWALLNLLPIYPLDGGQVARELFLLFSQGDGIRQSLVLSLCTAGAVAVFAIMNSENLFLFMMFGMLAYSSYQTLQAYGGGFGGRW